MSDEERPGPSVPVKDEQLYRQALQQAQADAPAYDVEGELDRLTEWVNPGPRPAAHAPLNDPGTGTGTGTGLDAPQSLVDDPGPLVRPYAMTSGRTKPRLDLALEALVVAVPQSPRNVARLTTHFRAIIGVCASPRSVAEISGLLGLPLAVSRVLIADMVREGLLHVFGARPPAARPSPQLLERVLGRLESPGPDRSHSIPEPVPTPVKVVISGGAGVGKTAVTRSLSDKEPLAVKVSAPTAGAANLPAARGEETVQTTTVQTTMDCGRVSLDPDLFLFLFGMPAQERAWSEQGLVADGAVGAIVLADARRLTDCFAAIDFFEYRGLPFVLGMNSFPGASSHEAEGIREALDIGADIPVVQCDARSRESTMQVLTALVRHALRGASGHVPVGAFPG